MVWPKTEKPTDICGHFQISGGSWRYHPHIKEILTCHIDYTESLRPPPGTHEACRLPQSLAYEAQVCLTLAWPGQTESPPVICRPTWPLANTVGHHKAVGLSRAKAHTSPAHRLMKAHGPAGPMASTEICGIDVDQSGRTATAGG